MLWQASRLSAVFTPRRCASMLRALVERQFDGRAKLKTRRRQSPTLETRRRKGMKAFSSNFDFEPSPVLARWALTTIG